MTTIKDILGFPIGQRTGGYEYTVKTAKKKWEVSGEWFQYVMLTDGKDEILAEVQLTSNIGIQRNTPIRIVVATRDERDVNNKKVACLYVYEWCDASPKMTADEYEYDKQDTKIEYDAFQEERIRGMCKYGEVLKFRELNGFNGPIPSAVMTLMDGDVDFIMLKGKHIE